MLVETAATTAIVLPDPGRHPRAGRSFIETSTPRGGRSKGIRYFDLPPLGVLIPDPDRLHHSRLLPGFAVDDADHAADLLPAGHQSRLRPDLVWNPATSVVEIGLITPPVGMNLFVDLPRSRNGSSSRPPAPACCRSSRRKTHHAAGAAGGISGDHAAAAEAADGVGGGPFLSCRCSCPATSSTMCKSRPNRSEAARSTASVAAVISGPIPSPASAISRMRKTTAFGNVRCSI